jgi:hypothetical protein
VAHDRVQRGYRPRDLTEWYATAYVAPHPSRCVVDGTPVRSRRRLELETHRNNF